DRWIMAGGKPLLPIKPREDSIWPEKLTAQFTDVEIGIARTRAAYRDWESVDEIETLFLDHIARARRFIYAESQYFASRTIAEAIAKRMQEDDPPEIVIVHPANADGWLEQQAMDHARAQLVRSIEEADRGGRFSIWSPYREDVPIYVHAKIMIVDDEILRIGSANLNNRSLGLDTECDVFIDSTRAGNAGAAEAIRGLRVSLLAEHCGVEESEMSALLERHAGMAAAIDHTMKDPTRRLKRYHPPELDGLDKTLAESQLLDPEDSEDLFEPFAKGGLFRKGSRLARLKDKFRRSRK
ncbi:MAG: phospholipase D-like domain-containing protein, partial [Qipengyuania sp.]